jgi:hypothetical protein
MKFCLEEQRYIAKQTNEKETVLKKNSIQYNNSDREHSNSIKKRICDAKSRPTISIDVKSFESFFQAILLGLLDLGQLPLDLLVHESIRIQSVRFLMVLSSFGNHKQITAASSFIPAQCCNYRCTAAANVAARRCCHSLLSAKAQFANRWAATRVVICNRNSV